MTKLIILLFNGVIKIFRKKRSTDNLAVKVGKGMNIEDIVNTELFLYGGSVFDKKHK